MKVKIIVLLSSLIAFLNNHIVKTTPYRTFVRKFKFVWEKGLYIHNLQPDPIYPILEDKEKKDLKNCVKLSFVGDLILLRDAVERAYRDGEYSFKQMFEMVSSYWKNSDFAIGVFEGPMAGKELGYSFSNYDDGYKVALNFPDSFAKDLVNAGLGFVTTATNHIWDKQKEGFFRTLKVLDEVGLPHTGTFDNKESYEKPCVVEVKGLKIAILAYTYGSEGVSQDFFFKEENKFMTKLILPKSSKNYKRCRQIVREDFVKAKRANSDLILVLPHMGEQFLHEPDSFQKHWCNIFVEEGADIILSDHPHAVQPFEWRKNNDGKNVFIAHCPGNFLNTYTLHDGDASMLINVYVDKGKREPICASCVPLFAHCTEEKGWYSLPICKAIKEENIYNSLSIYDRRRIEEVHRLVTKVSIGCELGIDNVQDEYFYFANGGYKRERITPLDLSLYCGSKLLEIIEESKSVCFVGDSVTEGMKNGGYGWYEPIAEAFGDKTVYKFALGAQTSRYFKEHKDTYASYAADTYIMAFGCNDIRYRNPNVCAMTSNEYIQNYKEITDAILAINKDANIICIAPWYSMDYDPYCGVSLSEKPKLYEDYLSSLKIFCEKNGFMYIDANPEIFKEMPLSYKVVGGYLRDQIHPTSLAGIRLFSEACLKASM